jgi:hypothetical protein
MLLSFYPSCVFTHSFLCRFKNSNEKFITVVADDQSQDAKKVYIINKEFMIWAEIDD